MYNIKQMLPKNLKRRFEQLSCRGKRLFNKVASDYDIQDITYKELLDFFKHYENWDILTKNWNRKDFKCFDKRF